MSTLVGSRRWSALSTALALVLAVGLTACSDSSSGPLGVESQTDQLSSTSGTTLSSHAGETTVNLVAGQDNDVGDVTIIDDGEDLTVEIVITDGDWCLTELHIHAADTEDEIPQNRKGNPQPGHFDINEELDCATNVTRSLGLPDNDGEIAVAVHTVVQTPRDGTLFGTDRGTGSDGDRIFTINPLEGTAASAFDTDLSSGDQNYPNGNAYDESADRLFYSQRGTLFSHVFGSGTQTNEGALASTVAGATYWDGAYHYVPQGTDDLYKATPGGNLQELVAADFSTDDKSFGFGDLIFANGQFYGSSTGGSGFTFFRVNTDGTGYENLCEGEPDPGAANDCPGGLQLAVGTGGTVFGHDANSGVFYKIDLDTQTTTVIGTVSSGSEDDLLFTDLASGPQDPRTETAWAEGERFVDQGNWGMYIEYEPHDLFVVAGWTDARGGDGAFPTSSEFSEARDALGTTLTGTLFEYKSISELSATTLSDVDMLVLSSVAVGTSTPVEPLDSSEETALKNFVEGGKCALLMPDNDSFGAGADAANESLIDPFGLDITGTISDEVSFSSGGSTGLLDGVTTIHQGYPGWFDGTGSATVVTNNPSGPAVLEVEQGGGRAVVFSDVNMFWNTNPTTSLPVGNFSDGDNETLFVNAVEWCLNIP